jgi:hypothetical protein
VLTALVETRGIRKRVLGGEVGKYKDNEPMEGPGRGDAADPEGSTATPS